MGIFDSISDLASAALDVAVTPVEVVRDVVAGEMFEEESNTEKRLKKAVRKVERAIDEVTDD